MQLEMKIAIQNQARQLAAEVAPGVPFPYLCAQLKKKVHTFQGIPMLKDEGRPGSYSNHEFLSHPKCQELRQLVKSAWK